MVPPDNAGAWEDNTLLRRGRPLGKTTFEESLRQTSSARQADPPELPRARLAHLLQVLFVIVLLIAVSVLCVLVV